MKVNYFINTMKINTEAPEYPFPTDENGLEIESISARESAKIAFKELGEMYGCVFKNKYTE